MNAATNLPELTVSELAFALKRTIEDSFGLVRVRGELSGYKRASSGHVYFALKDEQATLDAVLWRGSASKLSFVPEDGLEVVCTGRLTTYPGRSRYQLVVDRMEPAGLGALMAMLEERRRRLTAEGLFDPARKRPLPFLPEVIGVVTSPTGAVIRDILHRLADRFPRRVILWPVRRAGRGGGRAGGGSHQRLLRPAARRPGAAPGRGHRRPRRRLGRGPVGVQRGSGGPRRRVLVHPPHLRRRPRDRHHADRPRRRHARPDANRSRRARRPGPPRPAAPAGRPRRPAGARGRPADRAPCASGRTASSAASPVPRRCSGRPRNAWTTSPSASSCARRPGSWSCSASGSRAGPAACASWRATRCIRRKPASSATPSGSSPSS